MDKKTIVVVGAGQGLGNHVAKRFGKEGFRVVLMARNGEALKRYQQEFTDECIETFVHEADAERMVTLDTAFAWVKQRKHPRKSTLVRFL
jgi:short-subunit dehydrogenase